MAIKAPTDKEAEGRFNELAIKHLARVYALWLAGIAIGVVQIRPENIDIGGVKYHIGNPEVIQGVVFFACILYYVAILANVIVYNIEHVNNSTRNKRRFIYAALGKKRTLLGRTKGEVKAHKGIARLYLLLGATFMLAYALLPLVHIAFFEQVALYSGLDAVFNTTSVKEGKVILSSKPSLVFTGFILCLFTGAFYGWIKRRSGENIGNFFWACAASASLYALLDSYIRGQETWSEAVMRIAPAQVVIFAIVMLFVLPLKAMLLYQDMRLWWYRRQLPKK
jgi:hypothetical protein